MLKESNLELNLLEQVFEFRELTLESELLDYFRLRYQVYLKEGYLPEEPRGVDLDAFDGHSRFIGAFLGGVLVAGARMILPQATPNQQAINSLAESGQLPRLLQPQRDYHSQGVFDLEAVFAYCRQQALTLVEFGRTVVAPELRSTGLGLKLVYALYGLALAHGVEVGFAAVPPKLKGFYQKSDCRFLESHGLGAYPGISTDLSVVVIDLRRLTGLLQVAQRVSSSLRRSGSWKICEHPHCLDKHRHSLPGEDYRWHALPSSQRPQLENYTWAPAITRLPLLQARFSLHDQTLGNGLRSSSVVSPLAKSKALLLDWLVELGIGSATLGFPGLGGWNLEHCLLLAQRVADRKLPLQVACRCRAVESHLLEVVRVAQISGLGLEAQLTLRLGPSWSLAEIEGLRQAEKTIELARREGLLAHLVVEDSTRSRPADLEAVFHRALQAGCQGLSLVDSAGFASPQGAYQLVDFTRNFLLEHGYSALLEWQGYNDRGLALANALAALEAGVDRIQASALGVGERAGQISLEGLLLQLQRLANRELNWEALRGYLIWASKNLEIPVPAYVADCLLEMEKEVPVRVAVA